MHTLRTRQRRRSSPGAVRPFDAMRPSHVQAAGVAWAPMQCWPTGLPAPPSHRSGLKNFAAVGLTSNSQPSWGSRGVLGQPLH
jgi:hypothetical protein